MLNYRTAAGGNGCLGGYNCRTSTPGRKSPFSGNKMDKWTFGLTMMIVATGGTFLTLWILGLLVGLLKKIFPLTDEADGSQKKS